MSIPDREDARTLYEELVLAGRFDWTYFQKMQEKLFFEGEGSGGILFNYGILLTLATIISTYGVISGSTATVIGAMIVAPLMTPIMAASLAIVLGDSTRTGKSLAIVFISILYVIVLSILLSLWISPLSIAFSENSEVSSRTAPDMLALYVALASGAAGAFAISREKVGDSMPGVAIAISVVPPLSVVGISLAKGQIGDATGAFLLFLTNFFAILVAGGAVFWLSGINPWGMDAERSKMRKRAFFIAGICTVLIAVPLFMSGYDTLEQTYMQHNAVEISTSWLSGSSYRLTDFSMRSQNITIQVSGSGDPPMFEELHQALKTRLEMPVTLKVRIIPEEEHLYPVPEVGLEK